MLILEQLEDTILYDAGLAADIANSFDSENNLDINPDLLMSNNVSKEVTELVIIDNSVAEQEKIISDNPGVEYYVIGTDETLDSLTAVISTFSDLKSIHIISHGSEGQIELAGQTINESSAENNLGLFEAVKNSLSEDGDLLLYGCNVAEQEGLDFITLVSQLTEADVAASDDLTGSVDLGGDWDLEQSTGDIETDSLIIPDYDNLLRTIRWNVGATGGIFNGHLADGNQQWEFRGGDPSIIQLYHVGNDVWARALNEGTVTVYFFESGGRGDAQSPEQHTFIFSFPNQAPTGENQSVSVLEDSDYIFQESDFSDGFSDADGDPFTGMRIDSLPVGSLTLNGNTIGSGTIVANSEIENLVYRAPVDQFGSEFTSFNFSVFDGTAYSSSSYSMTIDVAGVNDAPVILSGSPADTGLAGVSETTTEDTALILNLSNYVYDADNDFLSISVNGNALHGSVIDNLNGTITYNPVANYFGSDNLCLIVTDGEFNLEISIPVTITSVNDAPIGGNQQTTVLEDSDYVFQTSDFSSSYTDIENDPFAGIRIESLPNGLLTFNGTSLNVGDEIASDDIESLIYRAPVDQFGNSFTGFQFSVFDGSDYSIESYDLNINVTPVNDAPVIRSGSPADSGIAGASETVLEDQSLTLTLSDYILDVDGDHLSLNSIGTAMNGNVVDNGNGTITYTPDENYFGSDSLSLSVSDGEFTVDIDLPVVITAVNDLPMGHDQQVTILEDTDYNFEVSDFSNGYSDIENDPFSGIRIESLPIGTLTLNGTTVDIGDEIAASNFQNLVYRAPQDQFGENYTGFNFSVFDGKEYSADTNYININVTAVNDAPVVRAGSPADTGIAGASETTEEDTALILNLSDYVYDADNDFLSLATQSYTNNGSIVDNGDGTVTYSPSDNYFGRDVLNLNVSDGELSVNINVPLNIEAVNDAPVGQADAAITDFNTALDIDVLNNDSDVENDPLTVSRIVSVQNGAAIINGSTVTFTPARDFIGTASVVYEISDGQDVSTSIINIEVKGPVDFVDSSSRITKTQPNPEPTAVELYSVNLSGSDQFGVTDGEYSITVKDDILNTSHLSKNSLEITDGEYSVYSLAESFLNLHPTFNEPVVSKQLDSAIGRLISEL